MKSELIKQLAVKTIKKVVIFSILTIVFTAISQSIAPVVTNELAMTQMENSNEMYILMSTYNKIRPVFNIIYSCIVVWFMYGIGRDMYKFAKAMTAEN